jgi:cytochrome c peroxidase
MKHVRSLSLIAYMIPSFAVLAAPIVPAPVTDALYDAVNQDEARLGQLLFWDPILSGNRNISCATCHHPRFGTADGVSLSLGEGGIGLGPKRHPDPQNLPEQRIPRNAPALFNLGATQFTVLFHDGRIEADATRPSGIRTPLEDEMTLGFSGVLSAQTMFPVLSPDEMAGHYSENDVAKAVRQGRITGLGGGWDIIAKRVAALPAYKNQFSAVYPEIAAGRPIAFTDISNAIAAFIAFEWRSDNSPFDAALRGTTPLPDDAAEGEELFYGDAGCSACHSGPFQTDHAFHAMGQPQIGPGKAERFETHHRDVGRMRVTGRDQDAYAFRTPSLRNVMRTGPWGHAGAYSDLRAFLTQHVDPAVGMAGYTINSASLPQLDGAVDNWVQQTAGEPEAIAAAVTQEPVALDDAALTRIIAFLDSLTDPVALAGRYGIPETVPSGLPLDR